MQLVNSVSFTDRPHFTDLQLRCHDQNNYLNRSVQHLPEGVHKDIIAAINRREEKPYLSNATKEILWNVAAWTSIIAFSAITVGSFVAVGVFFPIYLPFVPLFAYLTLEMAIFPGIQSCFKSAEAYKREQELKTGAERIYQTQLAHLTPQEVANKIRFLAHDQYHWELDTQLDFLVHCYDFKPILSEYMFKLEEELVYAAKVLELDQLVTTIKQQIGLNPSDYRTDFLQKKMNDLYFVRQQLSYIRINIAAQRSILCQPRQDTNIRIGVAPSKSADEFIGKELAQNFRDPSARKIYQLFEKMPETYVFPDRVDNLSVMETESLSIGELARHITQASRKQVV